MKTTLMTSDAGDGNGNSESAKNPRPMAAIPATLSSLGIKNNMQAVVEFKDGLRFKLCYVSRSTLNRLLTSCTEFVYNSKLKTREPKLNLDNFVEQFSKIAVAGWEGATLRVLSGLAPLDTSAFTDAQLDAPFLFSQENLIFLMKNVYDLDDFLQNAACDVKFFPTNKAEAVKNS